MKENKIEKLILDLSNRWECTPQEAVDRLNSMNESEINKLINSMTKKFQVGGRAFGPKIPYGNYMIMGTKTEVLPKKSEVTQSQIDSAYNAEQDAFRKRAEQLIPELEQRNAETKQRLGNNQNWQTIKANSPVQMPVTNSDPQYVDRPRNFKFKNGGFINCLRAGGTIPECKCGKKIVKGATGMEMTDPPTRGTLNAYTESYPKFDSSDTTWTETKNGFRRGYVKNVFDGTTLDQNLVTYDENGTPRRSIRQIRNYGTPNEKVRYQDPKGNYGGREPGPFDYKHSKEYMDSVDAFLEGMYPKYNNEREVKIARWKNRGNWLDKLRLAIFDRDNK